MTSINADGNFELEHMNMRDAQSDVFLSDGEAFMVQSSNYNYHLGIGEDTTEVGTENLPITALSKFCYRSPLAAIIGQSTRPTRRIGRT